MSRISIVKLTSRWFDLLIDWFSKKHNMTFQAQWDYVIKT